VNALAVCDSHLAGPSLGSRPLKHRQYALLTR